jgi:hypothetical protein
MGAASPHYRTITPRTAMVRLPLPMRRCLHRTGPQFRRPYRPEAAGRLALPKQAFGRAGVTLVGTWREAQPRRLPDIHPAWVRRRVAIAPRTVPPLVAREAALVALSRRATPRLPALPQPQGRVSLARAGRPPDGGPEGRWGRRDGLSGAGLLAQR